MKGIKRRSAKEIGGSPAVVLQLFLARSMPQSTSFSSRTAAVRKHTSLALQAARQLNA